MTLAVTCPSDWKAVSNSIDIRYDEAALGGKRTLQRHEIEWFLDFYKDPTQVALYAFE